MQVIPLPAEIGVDGVPFRACLCLKLRMSARQVTAIYDEHLAPAGLRITQFGLLAHLAEKSAPMAIAELATALHMDPTTLNRNLKPLARDGLLRIEQAPQDRRMKAISLTEAGASSLREAGPLWKAAHDRLLKIIGPSQASDLTTRLDHSLFDLARAQPKGVAIDG